MFIVKSQAYILDIFGLNYSLQNYIKKKYRFGCDLSFRTIFSMIRLKSIVSMCSILFHGYHRWNYKLPIKMAACLGFREVVRHVRSDLPYVHPEVNRGHGVVHVQEGVQDQDLNNQDFYWSTSKSKQEKLKNFSSKQFLQLQRPLRGQK